VTEFTYPSVNPGSTIHAFRLEPEGEVRGVVQIAHGMAERISRYYDFAQFLAAHGYVVTGNDHLGHGKSKASNEDYGFFGPFQNKNLLVEDMHQLTVITREQFGGLPYFVMGHSMGSFLLREYLTMYGGELTGAIIMGTGNPSGGLLGLGLGLSRLIGTIKGDRYRSPMIANMVDGTYNRRIEDAKTPFDWLSTVPSVVEAYNKDESTGFRFTMNGFEHMFSNIIYVVSDKAFSRTPKEVPLLLISGEQDPVGGYGEQVQAVLDKYQAAGVEDVSMILYPNDRHEVLNEADRLAVYDDILAWLDRYVAVEEGSLTTA